MSQYTLLVDRLARFVNAEPEFEPVVHYGQLLSIYILPLPASPELKLASPTTLVLACIKPCAIPTNQRLPDGTPFFTPRESSVEVVDLQTVAAVVGRVEVGNLTYIIDRSGVLADVTFVDN